MRSKSGLKVKLHYLYLAITGAVFSCQNSPDFPDTPRIDFVDVQFREVGDALTSDSLIVIVSFEDGDGDLGLDSRFSEPPFHEGDFFIDTRFGNLITIKYLDSAGFDLPPYTLPFRCINWLEREISEGVFDTLYFEPNPNHDNMELTFLIFKDLNDPDNTGDMNDKANYDEFDWVTDIPQPCGFPLELRFPVLQDPGLRAPLEGTIRYGFVSTGLLPLFENSTMWLEIRIRDRNLNVSNTVDSGPFELRDIQIN